VIFTTYQDDRGQASRDTELASLQSYREIWRRIQPETDLIFDSTIKGAMDLARQLGKKYGGMNTLVTGSQHLVGGALRLMERAQKAPAPLSDLDSAQAHL
jgi:folylpolyglutamate synthase